MTVMIYSLPERKRSKRIISSDKMRLLCHPRIVASNEDDGLYGSLGLETICIHTMKRRYNATTT
jgi:hypothetical protein